MRYDREAALALLAAVRVRPEVGEAARPLLEALAGPDGRLSVEDALRVMQALLDEAVEAAGAPRR